MRPLFTAVVWLAVAAHLAFLVYLPIGGFVALRWPRTLWLHVAVVLWAAGSVVAHWGCPLTDLERWARSGAGMADLGPAGFIDHYIDGVVYPAGAAGYVQAAVFAAVALSWALVAGSMRRSRAAGAGRPGGFATPMSG